MADKIGDKTPNSDAMKKILRETKSSRLENIAKESLKINKPSNEKTLESKENSLESESNESNELAPSETSSEVSPGKVSPGLPEFTLHNVLLDIKTGFLALLYDPECNKIIGPLVICLSSLICKFIIAKVPYTEIDFVTYMQQILIINDGELDYSLVTGNTGPIVYPAGYVQIYQWIHWITDKGQDIPTAQTMFGYLFALTNLLVVVCYSMAGVGPWPLYLLLCSKRLFSIYVLRLFNDCFTTLAMVGVTVLLQQASYWYRTSHGASFGLTLVAADLFSVGISIKMNALLYLPGFLIVAYFLVGENLAKFCAVVAVIPLVQILMGWRFLLVMFDDEDAKYIRWTYINQAFNFSRAFLYKWTVNWKFVSEETFLSPGFAKLLLVGNVAVLAVFVISRYISRDVVGKSFIKLLLDIGFRTSISSRNLLVDKDAGPRLIMMILATSNLVGVLFARSLHYQFLSWYCWQLPFLLYLTGWGVCWGVVVWGAHEWCWNVYPATGVSSGILVTILGGVLVSVWRNTARPVNE
jgi:alpha-1,3-mannosyltransferase